MVINTVRNIYLGINFDYLRIRGSCCTFRHARSFTKSLLSGISNLAVNLKAAGMNEFIENFDNLLMTKGTDFIFVALR